MPARQRRLQPLTLILFALAVIGLVVGPDLFAGRASGASRQGSFAPGRLVTQVIDQYGRPAVSIVVIQGPSSQTGRTDEQGFYRVSVQAGTYVVSAFSGAQTTETRRVTVTSNRTSRTRLTLNVDAAEAGSGTPQQAVSSSPSGGGAAQLGVGFGAGAQAQGGNTTSPSGSGANFTGSSAKPVRIKSLKADPGTTEPGGTSVISAVVDNSGGSSLIYAWTASGGSISGKGTQANWVAPSSAGLFTVSLTVTDSKKRSDKASVSIQSVDSSSADPAPTPTDPAPAPSDPAPSPGSRDLAAWPFATASPWNYPIGSAAEFQPVSTSAGTGIRGGSANITAYSIPTYVATAADPLRNIYDICTGKRVLKATIRVPLAAKAAAGTDGHLNIIDENHAFVHELYHAQIDSNGDLTTWKYNKNDLQLNGGGFSSWHGSVAAGTSSLGGVIRRTELAMGTGGLQTGIRHALQAVFYPSSFNRYAPGGRSFVWPASSSDNPSGYGTVGNVYMGSLLAIPPWINVNALGITDPQVLDIARALQSFGVYVVDGGNVGANNVVVRIDPQAAGEITNRISFDSQIDIPMRYLQVVTNSHLNGYAPDVPGGGGIPLQPLAPAVAAVPGTPGGSSLASAVPVHLPAGAGLIPIAFVGALIPARGRTRRRRSRLPINP